MTDESLFAAAADIADPSKRRAFLEKECRGDTSRLREIEALITANNGSNLLDSPPCDIERTGSFLHAGNEPISEGPGSVVGPYTLREQIGEGGMGLVFVAEQQRPVRRKVALKVIKPGMDSRQVVARFEAERQALALMDHPHIAKVLDAGTTESGRPYFVMELVRGVPITEYCDAQKLPPKKRLELFVQVCNAVQHAHQKGVIHRDLKPTNILVAPHDGVPIVKVIDFGVAKALGQQLTEKTIYTNFAQMIGTPLYMSPEQAEVNQLDVDTRSDIYSLGVLLYELLTGTTPFDRKRFRDAAFDEIRRIIREEEPPRPSTRLTSLASTLPAISAQRGTDPGRLAGMVRGELDWIAMRCLEKDRTRRYETAAGLAKDVQRYLADEAVEARPPSTFYRFRKMASRNKVAITTAGLVAASLLLGIGVSTWQAIRATRAERAAVLDRDDKQKALVAEEKQRQIAETAAASEKTAKEKAQRLLAQLEKGNEIIASIFTDLDINKVKEGTEPLEAILAERLVKAAKQLEGEAVGDPLVVARLQNRLGESLITLGRPQEAIPLCQKSRDTRIFLLGIDHADTLDSMANLAAGYHRSGQYDKALPLYKEAFERRKAKLGADHPHTLASMGNLASGYGATGQYDLALPLCKETLERQKTKLGVDHPHTLASMGTLALGYQSAGQLDKALSLYKESFERRKAKLGADHPHTLASMGKLALGYQDAGQFDLALPLYKETLERRKAKLGVDHPATLVSMGMLAWCYHATGQFDLALPLHKEALERSKAKLGADHPHTLDRLHNLASFYHITGQLDLALPLVKEALERSKAKLGADHPHTLTSMVNLASYYQAAGQIDLALPLFKEAMERRKVKLGADHPDTLTSMAVLGYFYLGQKQYADAEPLLRECFAKREKTQPERWGTFNARSLLGGVLMAQKKYAEAEQLLVKGYEGMKQREKTIPAEGADNLPKALDRLIQFYTETNKPEEARKWQAVKAAPPSKAKAAELSKTAAK